MKHCNNCKLELNTPEKFCPLCQSKLEGECTPVFPQLKKKRNDILFKIVLFISIITILVCGYIDYINNSKLTFSYYVLFGVVSFDILVKYILKSVHKDLLSLFYSVLFVAIAILLGWFGFNRELTVIPSLVVPIIIMSDIVISSILALILRQNYIRKYIHVMFMNFLFSLIPILLIIFKLTYNLVLAHISFGMAMVSIIGLLIFDFSSLKEEIYKMFYI